jgi:hypothetical protein
VFPVSYKLNFYMPFGRNSVFKMLALDFGYYEICSFMIRISEVCSFGILKYCDVFG